MERNDLFSEEPCSSKFLCNSQFLFDSFVWILPPDWLAHDLQCSFLISQLWLQQRGPLFRGLYQGLELFLPFGQTIEGGSGPYREMSGQAR